VRRERASLRCARGARRTLLGGRSTSPSDVMRSVYVITIRAVSSDDSASIEAKGACINVYATAPSEAEATNLALKEMAAAGWRCLNVDGASLRTREDYATDSSGLEYFEQALIDGVVLVVHTHPVEH